ncbi:hypothetical protein N431DRAFT_336838 [Stipitochalara longipes BDJ]|nr:hypothetical protein N431DRAFT_336838 [Stipitochalara longipes BDJ]
MSIDPIKPKWPVQIDELIRNEISADVVQEGHVYIFKAPEYFQEKGKPALLKIGQSTDVEKRRKTLKKLCKIKDLTRVEDYEAVPLRMYEKIEKLVHAELSNYRRLFYCEECRTLHQEWFEVSEDMALRTVQRWRRFIRQEPYNENGKLKDYWSNKIIRERMGFPPTTKEVYDFYNSERRWTKILGDEQVEVIG